MSTKRRRAREYALQILFQENFIGGKPDIDLFWSQREEQLEVIEFANELVRGALRNIDEIDTALKGAAEHWDLDRMAVVDRTILRLGAFELMFRDDIPTAVSINEALEVAKKFSAQDSAAFINGILDRVSKSRR